MLVGAVTCVAINAAPFVIVAYDNGPDAASMLQQSAKKRGFTYRVGALAPQSVRRYHSADRPAWLERELGNDSSSQISSELRAAEIVMMGDNGSR